MWNFIKQIRILNYLMWRDLIVLKKQLLPILFDAVLWVVRNTIIFGFILIGAGLPSNFGIFYFVSMIPTVSIIRIMHGIGMMLYDESTGYIDYELTLPISSRWVFLRKGFVLGLKTTLLSLGAIPVGLILYKQLNQLNVSFGKFILIFILINLLVGFATLWISSWIKNMSEIGSVWIRYLHTLWLFGCILFPWKLFNSMFPVWALINLLNPVTYIMEGIRSVTLDPSMYLDFWICISVITGYMFFFMKRSLTLLKRRFDVM